MTGHDVIVVGAGMIGSSAALALAEAGHSVALVGPGEPADRTTADGPFASHYDEGRITRVLDPDPLLAQWAAESIDRYGEIEDRSGLSFHTPSGAIRIAPRGAPSSDAARDAAPRDLALEEIDGSELKRRCPAIGLPDDVTVLWEPAPAGHVNPRRMVAALGKTADRCGVARLPVAAVSIAPSGDGAAVTLADGNILSADRVLVAVGPHALDSRLLPVRPDLDPVARTVVQIEVDETDAAYAGLPSFIVSFAADDRNYSFYGVPPVPYPGGGLWLKAGDGAYGDRLNGPDSLRNWFRSGGSIADARAIRDTMLRMFPGLGNARWRMEPCALVQTATERPFIGRVPGCPSIGIALGCNGYIAKSCIAVGRIAADMIRDDAWELSSEADPLRPRWQGA